MAAPAKVSPHRGIPQQPLRIRHGLYQTPSWREVGVSYQQDLDARTCSCWAFSNPKSKTCGQPCKHLVNAFLASFFESMERARTADTAVLERLVDTGRYDDRPDIKNACIAVLYERRLNLDTLPGPEPDDMAVDGQALHEEFEVERAMSQDELKRVFA